MRQLALIVLLAQMGSFVPADRARVGIVDRLFARIGALHAGRDALALAPDERRLLERMQTGLVIETGEAREVHHFCVLAGYGAEAVNPYLALYALRQARLDGKLTDDWDDDRIIAAYRSGVAHGMLKVMAKMGISTLQSYKGAQIFEALGLADEVVAPEALDARAEAIAVQLAAGPTLAFGEIRRLLLSVEDQPLEAQLELEAQALSRMAATADAREGLIAFAAKRKPQFTGR
jgi:hypothetical protein